MRWVMADVGTRREAGTLGEQRMLGHELVSPGCAAGCEVGGFALRAEIRCSACGTVFRFRRESEPDEDRWQLEELSDHRPAESCDVKRIRRELAAGQRAIRFQEHWRSLKSAGAGSR